MAKAPMMLASAGLKAAAGAAAPPPAASVGKLPTDFIQKHADSLSKPQGSLLDRLWGKMDKDKMRETGVGLINQALMQQPQRTPMAPFQPGGMGAMGAGSPGGAAQPQLVALAQQLGLNRVQ